MSASPTKLSLEHLREQGYLPAVVEKWNPHVPPAGIRQDLFGFLDILACGDGEILGVQTTSQGGLQERVRKVRAHENLAAVKRSGIRVQVHGWRKFRGRWRLRTVDV